MYDQKLFSGRVQVEKKQGWKRCGICGKDVASLFPTVVKVSSETFVKINQLTKESDTRLRIIMSEPAHKKLTATIDEISMKPITGLAIQLNIDICRGCIDNIGRRHKFLKNRKTRGYARKGV